MYTLLIKMVELLTSYQQGLVIQTLQITLLLTEQIATGADVNDFDIYCKTAFKLAADAGHGFTALEL